MWVPPAPGMVPLVSNHDGGKVSSPLRWGVLGASRFALNKAVPGMQKAPNVKVVALASRTRDKAQAAADALGIPRALEGYEALLADAEVEAVYIPLPNHLHVPWALRALEAGKYVLVEKPIALEAKALLPLLEAQGRTNLHVAEAFMVRHHPQWQAARRLVEEGQLGSVRAIFCAFSYTNVDANNIRNQVATGGGALYDIGCYAVNTARFLLGREPRQVIAAAERDPALEVDRLTSGLLDFGDVHATFTVGTQHVPHQRVQVLGTKARMEMEIPFNAPPEHACRLRIDPGADVYGSGAQWQSFPAVDQYALQAESFSRSVREGKPLQNDLRDALRTAQVIDALWASMRTGTWARPAGAWG